MPYCSGKELDYGGQAEALMSNLNNAQMNGAFDDEREFGVDAGVGHAWTFGVNHTNPKEWFTSDLRGNTSKEGGMCKTCKPYWGKGNVDHLYNPKNPDYRFNSKK